ncbi:hypothetical protein EGM51_14505 [Verrucomicrobia bacterium S94]|nr:hypothetical protein EGM51_14505 [Verrucomicrobia bacterium S94]
MSITAGPASVRDSIRWGAYLACSWTWCIGMFLPVLLLREMGWPGYLIFAVPNVIGAAAMGWVIKTGSDSVRFVEKHSGAVWWFSAITLAFHCYWISWLFRLLFRGLEIPGIWIAGGFGVFGAFVLLIGWALFRGSVQKSALVLLALSLTVLLGTFFSSGLQSANATLVQSAKPSAEPFRMLPVMFFGFLLCPYLDVTFHHARQKLETASKGRLGFTIGFVLFFPFMIFLTTRYAGIFNTVIDGERIIFPLSPLLAIGILLHIICQWFFTVTVHLDRIRTLPGIGARKKGLAVLLIPAGMIGAFVPELPMYQGLTAGEIVYRLFMSAYGLIFPAYMLYRVIVRKKAAASPWVMWIAMLCTSPFFWMGFIERQSVWLLPGLALLIAGAIFQKAKRRT